MEHAPNQPILGEESDQVYAQLRALAAGYLKRERRARTLQPTALVNEALLSLMAAGGLRARGAPALLGAAAKAMRHVLVDHARRSAAAKRGGAAPDSRRLDLGRAEHVAAAPAVDIIALNEALARLGSLDP